MSQGRRLELGQASVTRLPHEQISREHERSSARERRREAMQRHVAMAAVERGCWGGGGESEVRVQGNSIRVLYDFVLLVNFQNENSRRGWQTWGSRMDWVW